MTRHTIPDNFMQIDQNSFELWSLV